MSRPISPADFAYSMRPVGDDGKRRGHVGATCSACAKTEWVPAENPGWGTRLFKHRGWMLGNKRTHDVCKVCAAARMMPNAKTAHEMARRIEHPIATTKEPQIMTAIVARAAPPLAAAPPRERSLADNRRIRAELDIRYDEEGGRYYGVGSDTFLAGELKVPRAWVKAIRDLYGPDECEAGQRAAEALAMAQAKEDVAFSTAEETARRLLDMAAEADALVRQMRAARLKVAA